jgi:nucleotide-binding universal stress UspA family protein
MYSRILVPLDASDLAEQALPHAEALARCFGAELELLTVVHIPPEETLALAEPSAEFDPRLPEAQEYLEGLAARLKQDRIAVSTTVRRGDVAEEIIAFAADAGCQLIVMCTHGRSGVSRWVYGSIADRLLRYSPVPVMLVRASQA